MRRSALVLGLVAVLLSAAAMAATPSATSLLESARKRFAVINDYAVDIRMDLNSQAMTVKGMTMTLYYKKPNKTRVVAKQGFAAMPKGVMMGDVLGELTKNSHPVLVRQEKKNGVDCYVLRLDSTDQSAANRPSVNLWLDRSGLVRATQIRGPYPAKTDWRYSRVYGKYDLPSRIDAEITGPESDFSPGRHGHGHEASPAPSPARPSGNTQTIRATLSFSNYRVNKGISDSFFKAENPAPRKRK